MKDLVNLVASFQLKPIIAHSYLQKHSKLLTQIMTENDI